MRIGPDSAQKLEGGCSLIVGVVDADGRPHASRAWGARVLDDGVHVRVYLDADDPVAELATAGTPVAVTGALVRTLESVQLKGTVLGQEELTALDIATRERETEMFVMSVHETDHTPRELVEGLVPTQFVTAVVAVEELYDQTPGPQAGAAIPAPAS